MIEAQLPAVPEAYRDELMAVVMLGRDEHRLEVWRKASHAGDENEANGFRQDSCGAWIRMDDYGDHRGPYGWMAALPLADFPRNAATTDDLQPLHWQNAEGADGSWRCMVTSEGAGNVPLIRTP
jgi:hypothetical protein